MPPKDTQPHELFVSADGGETYAPLGEVAECGLIVDDLIPKEVAELPFVKATLDGTLTLSCTFNIRSDPSLYMLLRTGKWPSNNWLRLHGYPMMRRRKNRK